MKPTSALLLAATLAFWLGGCHGAHDQQHGDEHDHDHVSHEEPHLGVEDSEPHTDGITLSSAAIEHHGIKLGRAGQRELRETFSAPARVALNEETVAHVGTLVSGRVSRLEVLIGDTVTAGDLLFVIDSPDLGAAQNDHLRKLAEASVAATVFHRMEQFYQSGKKLSDTLEAISRSEVQSREVAMREAETKLKVTQVALATGRNKLKLFGMDQAAISRLEQSEVIHPHSEVHAPLAGTVIKREVTLGETTNPNQPHMLVLADLRKLWVIVETPPARANTLVNGQPITLTDPSTGASATAILDYISPLVTPKTRTVRARAVLENTNGRWRPGMFVTASLPIRGKAVQALAVPSEAVQNIAGQPMVFVQAADKEGTFLPREVAVGNEVAGWTPVKTGLTNGEPVVIQGGFLLKAELGKAMAGHDHSHAH